MMPATDPQAAPEPDMPATSPPTAIGAAGRKVLIVSPQPFYEDRGTPIAVGQLAAALCSLGFEVDLLAYPIGTPINLPRFRLMRGRRPLGIRSVRIGFSLKKVLLDLGMLGRLRALLRSGQYDVVHALEEMIWPVLLLCRGRKTQVIYDMQSSLPDQLRTHAIFRMGVGPAPPAAAGGLGAEEVERGDLLRGSARSRQQARATDSGARVEISGPASRRIAARS